MFCNFINDNNVKISLLENHKFTEIFIPRSESEVIFRRLHTYLINKGIISKNIIDLGAWIGDNSIPWSLRLKESIIYAIDPSQSNILFINQMCKVNNIKNIKTIQEAISDKTEELTTSQCIDHCSFIYNDAKNGKTKVNAVSLDSLYKSKIIKDIGYIHLDVEGMELRVIKGSKLLIDKFKPIITFEQHLELDNYNYLTNYLSKKGYMVYLINEILKGCATHARNFIAFPSELKINIDDIHIYLGKKVLLLISIPINRDTYFSCTMYGQYLLHKEYYNVLSIKHTDLDIHIFAIHDDGFTKMVSINNNGDLISSRYVSGYVNISDAKSLSILYESLEDQINKYSIKKVKIFT